MEKPKEIELLASLEGQAAYVNRFVASGTPAGVRIAFLEITPDSAQQQFRSAVLLSYQDAIELKNLLTDILGPVELHLNVVNNKSS